MCEGPDMTIDNDPLPPGLGGPGVTQPRWIWCDDCGCASAATLDASQPPEPGTWYGACRKCGQRLAVDGTLAYETAERAQQSEWAKLRRSFNKLTEEQRTVCESFNTVTKAIVELQLQFEAFTRADALVNFIRQYDGTNEHCWRARDRAIEIIAALDPSRVARFAANDPLPWNNPRVPNDDPQRRRPASATKPLKLKVPKTFFLNESHTTRVPKRKKKGKR